MNRVTKLAVCVGSDSVERMLSRQNYPGLPVHSRKITNGIFGWLGGQAGKNEGNALVIAGVPINGPNLNQIDDADSAARLLPEFDGAFAAIFWDETAGKLVIVTDFLGLQPLYMKRRPNELLIASETKAFDAQPDAAGWGAFISMGHTIGSQTLLQDVERLPPAALLVYEVANDRLKITRHWQWPAGNPELSTSSVSKALQKSIDAYGIYDVAPRLLLSGGFDSRLLLYALRQAGRDPEALIVAHDDELSDADGTLGRLLARHEGVRHRYVKPPARFFSSSEFLDYVNAADAAIPTMDLFISKVAGQIDAEAVWDGLVPGIALCLLFPPGTKPRAYAASRCNSWDSRHWKAARLVFGEEFAQRCHDRFNSELKEELAQLPDDDVGTMRFINRNRLRHRIAPNPLKVFSNTTLPFIPGMTKEFFALVSDLPRHTPGRFTFYFDLLRDCFPSALQLPLLKAGEIVRTSGGHGYYWKYLALHRRNAILGQHPRVDVRRLWRRGNTLSSFLEADDVLLQHDGYIHTDSVAALVAGDPLYIPVRRLLFHWKAWKWVHEQQLKSMLCPDAGFRND